MRTLRLLSLALAAPVFALAASTPSPLNQVVELPEFKVFENRPLPARETWDYVRVGNFEILSNTSKSTTKRFARDLSQFQIVLGIVAPAMLIRAEQPVMIVLSGKNGVAAKFAIKSAIPSTRGRGSSMVRDNEIASIVVDFQTRSNDELTPAELDQASTYPLNGRLWGSDWIATSDINTGEEFIRQYIHLSLSQLNPRPPAWVAEGLANIYGSIDYNNKWIEIGLARSFIRNIDIQPGFSSGFYNQGWNSSFSSNYASDASNYGSNYNYSGLSNPFPSTFSVRIPFTVMPMEKMFAVNYDSPLLSGPVARDDYHSPGWKTQTTAFVHMCLFGENGKYRQAFLKFASLTSYQPPTEALFKECFGVSYREMAFRIRSYSEFTNYSTKVIEAKNGGILYPADPINIRPASDAEIGRIKGETFRLSGQDEPARNEFVVAYLRGERDPQLLASLGLMARQRHDDARARTYLEAVSATATPVPRPRAYLELARLRAEAFNAGGKTPSYDVNQVTALLTPLFVAQRQPQQLSSIYLEIANVWEHSAITPGRDNLGALEYGVRVFPSNGELLLRTAALLIKYGYKSDAAPMIQRGLNGTRDPELKAKLEALRQQIDGPSPARVSLSTHFSPEANLGPELRQRLTDYRAARTQALTELRTQLDAAEKLPPARRDDAIAAFATTQAPRLRALESDASRLEADLGWPPDDGDDYAPGLTTVGTGLDAAAQKNLTLLASALQRPQGLSVQQVRLLREMLLEARDDAAARGVFFFFSPDTARIRLPSDLPPVLVDEIASYSREKDALKAELRTALASSDSLGSDVMSNVGLSALSEQQAPRFAALEKHAEAIRRTLATLPASRTASPTPPALPPALATRLADYQKRRAELQQNSRRDLLALRSSLPAGSGAELIASGDSSRLRLKLPANADSSLLTRQAAVDSFNNEYAARAESLNRELADLRREIADVTKPEAALPKGKSVNDLMSDFTSAALRQTAGETYRDCRTAVFQPRLSPEQRRLLFDRTAEKQSAFVIEL